MKEINSYIVLPDIEKKIEESIHDSITYFNKLCPYCNKNLFSGHIRNKIHIDHFVPINKGGQNVPWNVLPVCQKCNSKKKDKLPADYLEQVKYEICKEYLKKNQIRYVGQLQNDIERFLQIKSYLLNINLKNIGINEIYDYFQKVYQMTFEMKADVLFTLNNQLNTSNKINTYKDEVQKVKELFFEYFEPADSNKKVYKLTVNDIKKELQEKCNFEIRRGIISKLLREQGLVPTLERINSLQTNRIVRLSKKLQPT